MPPQPRRQVGERGEGVAGVCWCVVCGGEAGPGEGQLCGEPRYGVGGTAADALLVWSHAGCSVLGEARQGEALVCWKWKRMVLLCHETRVLPSGLG